MRIHTGLTAEDFEAARKSAGVVFVRLNQHGSRSRARAFDVVLEGSSGRRAGFGAEHEAATWDEWGIFLAEIFRRDPRAYAPGAYRDAEHFRWATGARYDYLTPYGQHRRHRWGSVEYCATGAYSVQECKCGAVRRWLVDARWQDIAG